MINKNRKREIEKYGEITEFLIQIGIIRLSSRNGKHLPLDGGLLKTIMHWGEENYYIPFIENGWRLVLTNKKDMKRYKC